MLLPYVGFLHLTLCRVATVAVCSDLSTLDVHVGSTSGIWEAVNPSLFPEATFDGGHVSDKSQSNFQKTHAPHYVRTRIQLHYDQHRAVSRCIAQPDSSVMMTNDERGIPRMNPRTNPRRRRTPVASD